MKKYLMLLIAIIAVFPFNTMLVKHQIEDAGMSESNCESGAKGGGLD